MFYNIYLITVQTYDEAALSARPMEVEQGGLTHIAYFPDSLHHSFPCYRLVWK